VAQNRVGAFAVEDFTNKKPHAFSAAREAFRNRGESIFVRKGLPFVNAQQDCSAKKKQKAIIWGRCLRAEKRWRQEKKTPCQPTPTGLHAKYKVAGAPRALCENRKAEVKNRNLGMIIDVILATRGGMCKNA